MAWTTPKFRPGINSLDPGLANEGGYVEGDRVRFWQGSVQPVGGWQLHTPEDYTGRARAALAWRTLEGKRALAWATASKLYAEISGKRFDITPNLHETVLTDCFTTESGSPIVNVNCEQHRLSVGDTVVFSNHQSTVGGLTIEGTYTVTEVLTLSLFTITHGSNASSTVSTPGGGNVDFVVPLPSGLESNPLSGYGIGTFGSGTFSGGALDASTSMRDWSLASWGEYLLANPSGYGLFEFQPELSYEDLAFNGTFDGDADGWALGTGWAYGSNDVDKTAGTGSNLSQDVDGILEGGRYYLVTFTVARTAGTLKFRVNAGTTPAVVDVGTASSAITKAGTYTRLFLCPADPVDVVFEADASFAGRVSAVSYQLIDRAYRIVTAPPRIDSMFVDPAGVVVALGTSLVDGSYSGTAYRCCDLGNNRSWIPDTGSIASEQVLRGIGGRLMAGTNTSEQNLVWGDEGVLSLQFQGREGEAFNPVFLGAGCGLISRHAMCAANGFVFWMSNTKQFFAFRGVSADALGKPEVMRCPIQNDIFDNIDYGQASKIHAGINSTFAEAWFMYPDERDTEDGELGECSRVAAVAWTEGTAEYGVPWSQHTIARTAWVAPGTFQNPIAFGAIGDGNYIFEHETGTTANGKALGEHIRTAPFDMAEGEQLLALTRIIPEFSNQTGNVDIYVIVKPSPNGTERMLGPYRAAPTTQFLPVRIMGRQMALKLVGVTTGGNWRLGALRLDALKTGAKR